MMVWLGMEYTDVRNVIGCVQMTSELQNSELTRGCPNDFSDTILGNTDSLKRDI